MFTDRSLCRILPTLLLFMVHTVTSQEDINMTRLGCLDRRCYYYEENPETWEVARNACLTYNDTFLVTVPDNVTRLFLHKIMKFEDGFWLGGHEVEFPEWRWLNNIPFYGALMPFKNENNKPYCGVVNPSRTKQLEGSPCAELKRFLCTSLYSDFYLPENHFISPYTLRLTWHQARQDCLRRGMDLARGTGNSTLFLYQLLTLQNADNFWIGITKSRFIWDHNGEDVKYTNFKTGEPNYRTEHCLQMAPSGEYNDKDCQDQMPFVCEWENTTTKLLPTEESPFWQNFAIILGTAAGGIVLIVISGAVCIVLLINRPGRKRARKNSRSDMIGDIDLYDQASTVKSEGGIEGDAEYDATNQFHYIRNEPAYLHDKKPDKKHSMKIFKNVLNTKSAKNKNKKKQKAVLEEGFDEVYDTPYVVNAEHTYQNSRAAVPPHYGDRTPSY